MIPYLQGGESASQAYMNALYSAFDAKLSTMLSGKSFFLAQTTTFPQKMCGRAFFFTSGKAAYAATVPGWIDLGGSVTRPYNHNDFLVAVAGINLGAVTWDETNKIAIVPPFLTSQYNGLTTEMNTTLNVAVGNGLLDWSLQSHYLMHQGSNDSAPVPYYIQEDTTGGGALDPTNAPEKRYNFSVAEIILEGVTNVNLPATYDKYNCFRVHNLNNTAATVNFAGSYTMTLQPLQCKVVRRDSPTSRYRATMNYFWDFEPGDPRFYWFLPKGFITGSSGTGAKSVPDVNGVCVTNSEAANNLLNPAILLEWANYFLRDLTVDSLSIYGLPRSALMVGSLFCGWTQDAAQLIRSEYQHYGKDFGDPHDTNTLIGDLIHHKGEFLIVRSSKTLTDPVTHNPIVVFEQAEFNGYATIVADFAAHQLAVTTNGSGNLVITSTDAANDVYIIPYGTNMFKSGESVPTCVSLYGSNSFTVESAILESNTPIALGHTGPQLIFQPTATTATSSQTWDQYDSGTDTYDTVNTVTGTAQTTLNWLTTRSSAKTLNGIQTLKVSDLLTLDYWGEPTVSGQTSTYVNITNRQIDITPEGILISFTETDSPLYTGIDSDWYRATHDGQPHTHLISMRGHGFGYYGSDGYMDGGWFSCRDGRYTYANAYTNEIQGPAGVDFSVGGSATQTDVKLLCRFKPQSIVSNGRFWSFSTGEWLTKLIDNIKTLDSQTLGTLWATSVSSGSVAAINNGTAPIVNGTQETLTMTLLPEMYNELARVTNSLTKCSPLSWRCIRWNVFGSIVGMDSFLEQVETGAAFNLVKGLSPSFIANWDASANSPALVSGIGVPGNYYVVSNAGTTSMDGISSWAVNDIAYFDVTGVWTKVTGGFPALPNGGLPFSWGQYQGHLPINLFATFDAGSQFEALCRQLGITVRDNSDAYMPTGITTETGVSSPQPFSYFANHLVGNQIIIQEVIATGSGFGSSGGNSSCNIATTIVNECLNTDAMLKGQATGTLCLGTWSDSLYPVTANAANIGRYYVVPADNPSSVLGSIHKGDVVLVDWSGTSVTNWTGSATGQTVGGEDLTAFANGFKWIAIEDVQAVIEAYGFEFAFFDIFKPATMLYYASDMTAHTDFFGNASSIAASAPGSGSGGNPAGYARNVLGGGRNRPGACIAFCATTDQSKALWKSYTMSSIQEYGYRVANLKPSVNVGPNFSVFKAYVSFDASSNSVGAGFGGIIGTPNNQILSRTGNTTIGSIFYAETAYSAVDFMPTSNADLVNQIRATLGTWSPMAIFNQIMIVGYNVVLSSGITAFNNTLTLLGREMYVRDPDVWLSTLYYANALNDDPTSPTRDDGSAGLLPITYVPAPASTTVAIGRGLTFLTAPSDNVMYTVLSPISLPFVAI